MCSNQECGAIVSHLTKLEGEEDENNKVCWGVAMGGAKGNVMCLFIVGLGL